MKSLVTTDRFLRGRLLISQCKDGYRFSIDAVILAHQIFPKQGERIFELGAGCGTISLILAVRYPDVRISGIEIQKDMAGLAKKNIVENRLQERVEIFEGDLKELSLSRIKDPVDRVVCNPPYRRDGTGRITPNPQKAVAMHEIAATLLDIIKAASRILRNGGRFHLIYPAERSIELTTELRKEKLEPKIIRYIYSNEKGEAVRVLVEAAKGANQGVKVLSPLVIYDEKGEYTPAIKAMFDP